MIAFEEQPELIVDPRCDAFALTFFGVALGMQATAVPADRVVEVTFSPLVRSLTTDDRGQPRYAGFGEKPLDVANVRASVVYGSGVLHTDADLSFTIEAAQVKKVSIHGRWLSRFGGLNSIQKLHEAFGIPDICLRLEADGDLLAYDSYYRHSRKWVRWMSELARPVVVTLGDTAEALHKGERGGVRRTDARVHNAS